MHLTQSTPSPTSYPALSPQEERATTVMIPALGASPSPARPHQEESSPAWFFLLIVGCLAMLGVWSLFGGQPTPEKTPAIDSAPLAATTSEAKLVELTLQAEPREAKLQAAAVSLGATVTQIGTLTAQLPAGEVVAITVSLEGYQTVQRVISATGGVQEILLERSPALSSPQKAPAQPRRASKPTPPAPRACLD